jgi:hypothetical protein
VIMASGLGLNYRCLFGGDGADQMMMIVAAGLLAVVATPTDSPWHDAGFWFIAAQSCLAYFTSGVSKAVAPKWRSGEAVNSIMRTSTYGHQSVRNLLVAHCRLAFVFAWAVIAFECLFPLALLAPREVLIAALAAGVLFHIVNAVIMGLNDFVPAFLATYPALWLVHTQLHGLPIVPK